MPPADETQEKEGSANALALPCEDGPGKKRGLDRFRRRVSPKLKSGFAYLGIRVGVAVGSSASPWGPEGILRTPGPSGVGLFGVVGSGAEGKRPAVAGALSGSGPRGTVTGIGWGIVGFMLLLLYRKIRG